MKQIAKDYYIRYHNCEAKGDFSQLTGISNYKLFNELKKKISSQNRKGLTITWNHTDPKTKLVTLRYLKFPIGEKTLLQVGVEMSSKQVSFC